MPRHTNTMNWPGFATDEAFRAAYAELKNCLTASGLVQTGDTGQVDVATVTKPTTLNAQAAYLMFRFADPLQSVAPVFLRISYGVGSNAVYPSWTARVGTGTDGAGNLTGLVSRLATMTLSTPAASVGAALPSYATHSNGFFALSFLQGVLGPSYTSPFVSVQRTCDNNGSPTAEGIIFYAGNMSPSIAGTVDHLRFLPVAQLRSYNAQGLGFLPGDVAEPTYLGLSPQAFGHFAMMPKCRPLVGTCAFRRGETAAGQVFPLALVGTLPRTYMSLGHWTGISLAYSGASFSGYSDTAILWED